MLAMARTRLAGMPRSRRYRRRSLHQRRYNAAHAVALAAPGGIGYRSETATRCISKSDAYPGLVGSAAGAFSIQRPSEARNLGPEYEGFLRSRSRLLASCKVSVVELIDDGVCRIQPGALERAEVLSGGQT